MVKYWQHQLGLATMALSYIQSLAIFDKIEGANDQTLGNPR